MRPLRLGEEKKEERRKEEEERIGLYVHARAKCTYMGIDLR